MAGDEINGHVVLSKNLWKIHAIMVAWVCLPVWFDKLVSQPKVNQAA
jgi:hypothetical protein